MRISRRTFLETGLLATGGVCTGCLSTPAATGRIYVPAAVPIARKAKLRPVDTPIRMAFIGVGGRGGANLNEFYNLGEQIVALCDVDKNRLAAAARKVTERFPKVHCYQDWRQLLEREKDLDAVVVSTPDHMHGICAIAAMEQGCHVYVEKPLVRTWWEAERFRDVAKACGVMTQMGNNGNGTDGQRRNIEILQSGVLGEIREIHVTTDRPIWPQGLERPEGSDVVPDALDWNLWLGVAPKRPFKKNVYHAFKWRGWFDFGTGAMGDIACHAMSFFWRGLDLRDTLSVETLTSTPKFAETYPAATTVKLTVTSGKQTQPIDVFWYDGKTGPDAETCRRLTDGKAAQMGGTLIRGERGVWWNGQILMTGDAKFVRHHDHAATRNLPQTLPRVKNHHWEFAEAVRGGARPFSHWDHSVPLTEAVLLGCIAQRVDGRLCWNAAEGRFTNSDAANALLKPECRYGWTIG